MSKTHASSDFDVTGAFGLKIRLSGEQMAKITPHAGIPFDKRQPKDCAILSLSRR